MPSEFELEKAMRLALLHDHVRKDVTAHLRWALGVFESYKKRMPKDEDMARAFAEARAALHTSES